MTGLLSGLFGLDNSTPVQTNGSGQVVGPVGGWSGILGGIGQRLRDASPELMGMGMGFLSGSNPQEGWANAMQGMQRGQLLSRQQKQDEQAQQEKVARQRAATAFLKAHPDLAQKYGADVSDPDFVQKLAAAQFGVDNREDKWDRVTGADGSVYAVNKADPTQIRKLGIPTAQPNWSPVTVKDPTTGTESTYFQRGSQFAKPGDVIPGYGQSGTGGSSAVPGQEIAAPPPGADPKKWREEMTKQAADQAAAANASAPSAQNGISNIDRAIGAYNKLAAKGGIGPFVGNDYVRGLGTITDSLNPFHDSEAESLRQEYEAARSNLELQKAQISMKGQGVVSDAERKLLRMTLPPLNAIDPQTGVRFLLGFRQELQNAVNAGKQSGLPDRSGRPGAMQGQTSGGISWGVKR